MHQILIVDDSDDTRELLRHVFRNTNWGIDTAPDSSAALSLFIQKRHDLVLSDYEMPGQNGLVLLQNIRAISPETPVIIVSGADDQLFRRAGVPFVSKPFSHKKLLVTVAQMLGEQLTP